MANKVTVLGSLNVDTTLRIARMPQPGETLSTENKSSAAGGKGANQAVAAARAGAETSFIGKVGNDDAGRFMVESLDNDHIDTHAIITDPVVGTGSAFILLDEAGQNSILVYGGSNQQIKAEEVIAREDEIANADFLITQFETPQAATLAAFKVAKQHGVTTILNPAPAAEIDPKILKVTDLVIPNETESAELTGIEVTDEASMDANAKKFREMGVKNLIITVGSKGAYYATEQESGFVPAFKVKAVDTTAAGDTFIGALSSQLKPDLSNVATALVFAQRASSLTVQGLGAMPSIPTVEQIEAASKK
ncbi:ribokinase [Levilactobacillus brevis]|uniref:Ribokinase n=1 Tax=Levilactobacillus brevis ATCC 14869 = DSM 20054 TaxID=649758 RepID=U2QYB5_LEVBR|nr:ribokinase [Levilactobacillus brevis]ERK43737.1 ribokinase [Levilactobacillus brevis ATCC 14869 = DSM 20054]KIO97853.1 Ribokinase [Levilactobacillus brevis]KRK21537.1 ribokinase family sugar kinase [Levilactobacillus brevis ATCC 14869 = DSM 20054]SQG81161.1 ribokinase family sugar kinase [Levilactobacillus brevis]